MAITCTAIYQPGDAPSGAAAVTDPGVSSSAAKQEVTFSVAASGIANATASTGFDALLAAVETYGAGTFATAAGLDSTATITMVAYVKEVTRAVDGATIWQTGTDNFNVTATFQWET